MPYLIDGHNLIPKLGLKLSDLDDEKQLIELLQEFCHIKQTKVEIYFDGANPGQASQLKIGRVAAYFVRKGKIADAAIETRLQKLGQNARNWSVVSSDRRVQASAKEVHARVISSDEFARIVASSGSSLTRQNKTDTDLSQQDVDEWMDLFKHPKNDR
jgi:predicted RNA-binding protein with PIN domain